MENTKNQRCLNCESPLEITSKFCHRCGQKVITNTRSVKELLNDFIKSFLDIDSQVFQTIRYLFIPAHLSIEYFKGRRKKYLNPFRLFFIITVIFLGVINFMSNTSVEKQLAETSVNFRLDFEEEKIMEKVDSVALDFMKKNEFPEANEGIDSLRKELKFIDSKSFSMGMDLLGKVKNAEGKPIEITREDIFTRSEEQIIKRHNITGLYDRILLRQKLKFYKDGGDFGRFLLSNILWFVLIVTCVYGLLLKWFFGSYRSYYVEHLVFALYDSSAAFLISVIALFLFKITNGISLILILSVVIFPFLSIKKFYQLSWKEAFVKYNVMSLLLLVITGIFVLATFIISFLLF